MRIGELAKASGIQTVTIRYYEKEGLLNTPSRSVANYRLYGEKDFEQLRFIKHCRQHGMSLSDIRQLLAYKDNPQARCDLAQSIVRHHIANVREQIESLIRLEGQLEQLLDCARKKPGSGIIDSLTRGKDNLDCSHK
ncbi:MAG: Mercuric resistance operon regulatory protein [Desulfovibrio sp.]